MKRIIFFLLIANNCFSQNPDGEIEIALLDSNKIIHFDFINNSDVIIDTSKIYTIRIFSVVPNGCGYTTPDGYEYLLFRHSINTVTNAHMVSLGLSWCGEVVLEITRKTKEQTDTMKIIFTGMYLRSSGIDITFNSGTYNVDIDNLHKEGKLEKNYFIKSEYLIKK
ncbi:MAG: hypothetical protein Q8R57_14500 [Bacteroidota bacterium]|nr:hypothetical protein [Bacteroidota bacterium]